MLLLIFIMVKLLCSLLGFLPFFLAKISCSCNNPSPPSFLNPIVKASLDFNSPLNQYLMLTPFQCQLFPKIINTQSFPLLHLYLNPVNQKIYKFSSHILSDSLQVHPWTPGTFVLTKLSSICQTFLGDVKITSQTQENLKRSHNSLLNVFHPFAGIMNKVQWCH